MFFKGNIFVTGKEDIIYNTPVNSNTKIISLDEDGVLIESDSIIMGTCLLPPVEAKIAEADGNEMLYDTIYGNHLLDNYQYQFISALFAYLYKGGNILIFLPEIECTNTTEKLIQHIYERFGVHIGLIGHPNPNIANCYYDEKCLPIWCNMIYQVRAISVLEYLYIYPEDAVITNKSIIEMLLSDINPYGNTIQDKINYIERFRKLIKKNPKVKPAISSSIRSTL